MGVISKLFGTKSEREIKKLLPLVDKTEALGGETLPKQSKVKRPNLQSTI